jgi:hypothetical protein
VLHDRHITDFPGGFAEWETVSSERAHAAAVTAAEEEALRRMHEKQKNKRREDGKGEQRNAQRDARKKAESAEKKVGELESRVGELTALLGDPALYTTEDGKKRAVAAGSELDKLKRKLDAALEEWTAATEAAESTAKR